MLIISYNNIITSFTNSYIAVSACMALWKLYNILWTKGKHICLNTDLISYFHSLHKMVEEYIY